MVRGSTGTTNRLHLTEPNDNSCRVTVSVATARTTPLLGCYGVLDRWIPAADLDILEREIARSPVPGQVNRYAGAGHGFHCDLRSTYHEPSARAAWAQTLAWLDTYAAR